MQALSSSTEFAQYPGVRQRVAEATEARVRSGNPNPTDADFASYGTRRWSANGRAPADEGTALSNLERLVTSLRTARELGGHHMGAPGQSGRGSAPPGQPDHPNDDGDDARTNAAIGEALTRMGGGVMANPDMTSTRSARRRAQVERLGITPFEASLLQRSGGL